MKPPWTENSEFARMLATGPARGVNLERLALEIAADAYPEIDAAYYLDAIDALAERTAVRCPARSRPDQVLRQINWVLYVEESYRGNTEDYYDRRNSYLNQVIERKRGIPISLAVLYRAIAARLGVPLAGVNLPGHFVLRLDDGDASEALFVDAFHEGVLLDDAGCQALITRLAGEPVALGPDQLAACPARVVVVRMLRNLKAITLNEQDLPALLPIQQRLSALCPEEPAEQRDLGLVLRNAGHLAEAIGPLERYIETAGGALDADPILMLLKTLRREVASWN